jgi:hypothetical protein
MDIETIKNAGYIVKPNHFEVKTDWPTVLDLIYKNSDNTKTNGRDLWIKIKDRRPFGHIPDLRDFCHQLNKDFESKYIEGCDFNKDWDKPCSCFGIWHIDGPVVSLSNIHISKHKDIKIAAYIQILGNSFWKLNDNKTITLKPSDVIFLNKDIEHEVWGEGPRFGVLLFAMDKKTK